MSPELESLIGEALAAPCGIAITTARPAALLAMLHTGLLEAGGQHSALAARMGATVGEVWLAPRALLPDLRVVGSLGPAVPIDLAALSLE